MEYAAICTEHQTERRKILQLRIGGTDSHISVFQYTECTTIGFPYPKDMFLAQFESKISKKHISESQSLRRYAHS